MYYVLFNQSKQQFLHLCQEHAARGPLYTDHLEWAYAVGVESEALRMAEKWPDCRIITILPGKQRELPNTQDYTRRLK